MSDKIPLSVFIPLPDVDEPGVAAIFAEHKGEILQTITMLLKRHGTLPVMLGLGHANCRIVIDELKKQDVSADLVRVVGAQFDFLLANWTAAAKECDPKLVARIAIGMMEQSKRIGVDLVEAMLTKEK